MAMAYPFVLEELQSRVAPDRLRVKPMFGSHALYFDEKIVFILRRKEGSTERDNGVWVAMLPERTESVLADFPNLRKIEMFGGKVFGGWLNLPETDEEFEGTAMELCRLVSRGDARIGKIPKAKKKKRA